MLNLTSKLGAELDSLADFLSFGVAPAVLAYLWTLHDVRGDRLGAGDAVRDLLRLRLARFNTELEVADRPALDAVISSPASPHRPPPGWH